MKHILVAALAAFSLTAFAADPKPAKPAPAPQAAASAPQKAASAAKPHKAHKEVAKKKQ